MKNKSYSLLFKLIPGAMGLVACAPLAAAATITWDFEGGSLTDTTSGSAYAFAPTGALTGANVITYASPTGGGTADTEHTPPAANEWFLRSDHSISGTTVSKPGDGAIGGFESAVFTIDSTSAFSFHLGGGTDTAALVLRDAGTDAAILTATPSVNGFIYDNPATGPAGAANGSQTWSSGDLTGAGIAGITDVYLTIEDNSSGGWGHVQADDIVVTNAVIPEPSSGVLGLLGLATLIARRRR